MSNNKVRRIQFYPAPHVEVRVYASEEMIRDYRECYKLAFEDESDGKDCKTCSWHGTNIGDMTMREAEAMKCLLEEEC